ncbi:MAG TPA: hypothetical protein VG755_12295 [Nannocystaceae bacterium]|nr:hypothetical protein [Nannocystaceae bacterium]
MPASSAWIVLVARLLAPIEEPGASPTTAPPVAEPVATTTMLVWIDASAPAEQWSERVQRVQAELGALGVRAVLFMPSTNGGGTPDVLRELDANDAKIAVWIAADRDRAELWVREGSRLVTVAIVTGEGDEDDGTFAVRCAEVAHALATEITPVVDVAPPPPREAPAPLPPPRPFARGDLRGGLGIGGASRDLGILLSPLLGGGVRLGAQRRVGLDAELATTALRGTIRGPAGTARLGWFVGRVHVGVWPVPRARLSPFVGLGGGVLVAWTRGRGEGAYESRRDTTVVGIGSLMLDLAIRLSPRLRLRPGTRIGVALPPLSIATGGARHRTALPIGELVVALDVLMGIR